MISSEILSMIEAFSSPQESIHWVSEEFIARLLLSNTRYDYLDRLLFDLHKFQLIFAGATSESDSELE